jgi:hypothetical protein
MKLTDAEDLAERALRAITESSGGIYEGVDRKRVLSDLCGLRYLEHFGEGSFGILRRIFSDGLRHTAALYGELPRHDNEPQH